MPSLNLITRIASHLESLPLCGFVVLLVMLLHELSSLMLLLMLGRHMLLFPLSVKAARSLILALALVFRRLFDPSLTLAVAKLSLVLLFCDIFISWLPLQPKLGISFSSPESPWRVSGPSRIPESEQTLEGPLSNIDAEDSCRRWEGFSSSKISFAVQSNVLS
uniref:Uncharacterized protein n=1 Tax=Arundo donax TaxID=35708 RepID=A0A0A9GCJ0_ARUDO